MDIARSKSGAQVRLPSERWAHIVEHHDDLAGYRDRVMETLEEPDAVARGKMGELLALKRIDTRTLVVVYREASKADGFVITAFLTTEPERIRRRGLIWQKS